jgi:hypothetical protein
MFSSFPAWLWGIPKKGANCNDHWGVVQGLFAVKFNFFMVCGAAPDIHGSASPKVGSEYAETQSLNARHDTGIAMAVPR